MAAPLTEEERFTRMTTAPVGKLVTSLAIPCIITNLITTVYNMADTYFIGRLDNTSASGAVGIALSAMGIIQAIGFFFGQGSGIFMARLLGGHNKDEAGRIAAVGFFTSLIAGVFVSVVGLSLLEPICRLLGSTETILPYAKAYIGIIFLGAPFMVMSLVMNQQLRQQGLSFYSMIGIGTSGILNMILDPVFIFTFDLGIAGAAWATIISQFISFVILIIGVQRKAVVKLSVKNMKPSWERYYSIYKCGLPSLARQAVSSVATAVLNSSAGIYGDAAVAAMAIVTKIANFTNACVLGYGQGFQPVCGFNYGAKKYDRVKEAYVFCVRFGTVFLIVMCALEIAFAPQLVEIFRKGDPAVTAFGAAALRYHSFTFWLNGFTIMNTMLFQVMGKTYMSTIVGLARQGLFLIPSVMILSRLIGSVGVQMAQCVSDVAAFIMCIFMIIPVWKELSAGESFARAAGKER